MRLGIFLLVACIFFACNGARPPLGFMAWMGFCFVGYFLTLGPTQYGKKKKKNPP